jgi:hypothetical protein
MKRGLLLALIVALVFSGIAAVLLQFMPKPLKDSDYLVVGSVATLVSLLVLFFMMAASKPGMFFEEAQEAVTSCFQRG